VRATASSCHCIVLLAQKKHPVLLPCPCINHLTMTESQRRKRRALLLSVSSIFLLGSMLPFQSKFSKLTVKRHVSTKGHACPSVLVPKVPDPIPTSMMNRAFIPKNTTLPTPTNPAASCPVTSQVRLVLHDRRWILESLDNDGKLKTVGGDEYYITYTDDSMTSSTSPTAVAFVRDCHSGTYELSFVTSPSLNTSVTTLSGTGTVSIILQYSCGIGHLAPPSKANWSTGGAINVRFAVEHVTAPPMKSFVPPHGIDLGQYDQVVAFGDSTMGHFVGRNLIWPGGNVGAPLNTDTIRNQIQWKDRITPSMISQIKHYVSDAKRQFPNVALLVGSGVWDIIADEEGRQGPQFHDHREALRVLVAAIRMEFPTLDLYWKSHTAMHIHRVADKKDWFHLERVFYMSTSRSYDLYRYQNDIMAELNVTFLDLYPATYLSAEQLRELDGRHYSKDFNMKMLNWFYEH